MNEQFRIKFSHIAGFAPVAAGVFIFILNNGRSAIFGFVFSLGMGMYFYARNYWRRKILKIVYPLVVMAALSGVLAVFSVHLGERFDLLLDSLAGKSKITDYQRYFLWQASLDVISDHPVIGVGPGNFQNAVDEKILAYSKNRPSLWYSYSVIQRGHSHNDMMHLEAIAGVFAVMFYLGFFFMLFYEMFRYDRSLAESWWLWGAAVIFPAGLFQCYFQDDEVLLPFWILTGLLLSKNLSDQKGKGERSESKKN